MWEREEGFFFLFFFLVVVREKQFTVVLLIWEQAHIINTAIPDVKIDTRKHDFRSSKISANFLLNRFKKKKKH